MGLDMKLHHVFLTAEQAKAMLQMVCKEDSRYTLSAVAIGRDGYAYATDGHILGRLKTSQKDESSLPLGVIPDGALTLGKAFVTQTTVTDPAKDAPLILVHHDALEKAAKLISKKQRFLNSGLFIVFLKPGEAMVQAVNIPEVSGTFPAKAAGQFPNVSMVWEELPGLPETLSISEEILVKVATMARLLDDASCKPCRIYLNPNLEMQHGFTVGTEDSRGFVEAIVMSCSAGNPESFPEFAPVAYTTDLEWLDVQITKHGPCYNAERLCEEFPVKGWVYGIPVTRDEVMWGRTCSPREGILYYYKLPKEA